MPSLGVLIPALANLQQTSDGTAAVQPLLLHSMVLEGPVRLFDAHAVQRCNGITITLGWRQSCSRKKHRQLSAITGIVCKDTVQTTAFNHHQKYKAQVWIEKAWTTRHASLLHDITCQLPRLSDLQLPAKLHRIKQPKMTCHPGMQPSNITRAVQRTMPVHDYPRRLCALQLPGAAPV